MKMVKTIYFDLGNVLIFFSLPKMFVQLGKSTGMTSEEIKTFFFNSDLLSHTSECDYHGGPSRPHLYKCNVPTLKQLLSQRGCNFF